MILPIFITSNDNYNRVFCSELNIRFKFCKVSNYKLQEQGHDWLYTCFHPTYWASSISFSSLLACHRCNLPEKLITLKCSAYARLYYVFWEPCSMSWCYIQSSFWPTFMPQKLLETVSPAALMLYFTLLVINLKTCRTVDIGSGSIFFLQLAQGFLSALF